MTMQRTVPTNRSRAHRSSIGVFMLIAAAGLALAPAAVGQTKGVSTARNSSSAAASSSSASSSSAAAASKSESVSKAESASKASSSTTSAARVSTFTNVRPAAASPSDPAPAQAPAQAPQAAPAQSSAAAPSIQQPSGAQPSASSGGVATFGSGGGTTLNGGAAQLSGGAVSSHITERRPEAPSLATVLPSADGGFSLMWADNSRGEVGFAVERDPDFANQFAILPANSTLFVDPEDFPQVRYRVRALGRTAHSEWSGWATGASMAAEFPVLTPSSGFAGPTPQPASVGNASMPGFDAKAIARWDVVPYQTFTGSFHIGVVAFHMNGIDRVEFSANGGPWVVVREMKLNPRTNVWEYTAVLKAQDFPDGPVEVRAVAYPKTAGVARVLGGVYDVTRAYQGTEWTGEYALQLFANSGGTLPDQVIELPAGDYTWGVAPLFFGSQADHSRWMIYRPAPGVEPSQVRITSGVTSYPRQRNFSKIMLQNLTINGHAGMLRWFNNGDDKMLWLDSVRIQGPGQWDSTGVACRTKHQWWTNCHITDSRDGMARQFVRNCTFERIGEDVIRESNFVVNSTVRGVDSGQTAWHSGVIGNPLVHDNRIYYGLNIAELGNSIPWPMRNGTHNYWENRDVAIVKCTSVGSSLPGRYVWFVGASTEHMLVEDSLFTGRAQWRLTGVPDHWVFQPRNVVLRRTTWRDTPEECPSPNPMANVIIDN